MLRHEGLAALLDDFRGRRTLDVTGPEALTGAALAALVSELTGRETIDSPISTESMVEGMVARGIPQQIARIMVTFDVGAAAGRLAAASDTVLRLTAQAPQSVRDCLKTNLDTLNDAGG